MLKRRMMAMIVGVALLLAVAAVTGIVVDVYGLDLTSTVHACNSAGSSGGGC
jgi:hypothetical protein